MPLVSQLNFASLLSYCPRGKSELHKKYQSTVVDIKNGDPRVIQKAMERLNNLTEFTGQVFPVGAILVPVPRRIPNPPKAEILMPALLVAEALQANGIGSEIERLLRRKVQVNKSAISSSKDRPKAIEHYNSLGCDQKLLPENLNIVLVDDVITRGATVIGCASRIKEVYPGASITAFALVRAWADMPDSSPMLTPTMGVVMVREGECYREP